MNFAKRGAAAQEAAQGSKKQKLATRATASSEIGPQLALLAPPAATPSPPRQQEKLSGVIDISGKGEGSAGPVPRLEELSLSEGVGMFVKWFEQAAARGEEEKGRYAEQLAATRAKLRRANDEVAAVRAELASQQAKTSEAELAALRAREDAERLGADLAAARAELKTASSGQGEVLRTLFKRLLQSGQFSAMANELAGLINGNAAVDALEDAAKDYPGLEASKYGYERLEGASLILRYAEVIRNHLGRFPMLDELASSPGLLTVEQIAACSVDRDLNLEAAFDSLPGAAEEDVEMVSAEQELEREEAVGEEPKGAGDEGAAEEPHSELEKEPSASSDVSLNEQINLPSNESTQLRDQAVIWMERYRRADALFNETCARLKEKEFELEGCQLELETFREEARVRLRAGQEKTDELQARLLQAEGALEAAESRSQQLVGPGNADELQAQLCRAEEELEVARGRADRVVKDHENIVQEHAEYEELIQRRGGCTISDVEEQTDELMEQYRELREECLPGSRPLQEVLGAVARCARMYKTVLARRPQLRALLASSSGEATASTSQERPQVGARGRPQQIGPSRGGRAAVPGSSRVRGRRPAARGALSRGWEPGRRLSIDDLTGATSFEDRWLNFSRPGPPL